MTPSSPKEAKACGAARYFTGKPCRNGHVAERRVGDRGCVACGPVKSKKHYAENREAYLEAQRAWQAEHRETVRASARNWKEANREKVRQYDRGYKAANPARMAAYGAKKRASKRAATLPWLTAEHKLQIEEIYADAQAVTALTGIIHEVDHIYPLQGQNCCGLHVPWNLQILPQHVNRRKYNRMPEEFFSAEIAAGHKSALSTGASLGEGS